MCGIVGYIGDKQAQNILVDGLKRLEYRGYDSSGVAVLDNNQIEIAKKKGKIKDLEGVLVNNEINGTIGIGHTRWATHGEPSDRNAHPHFSMDEKIAIVHNGIIENYNELREELKSEGYKFNSDTDTEVIVHLVEKYYDGDLLKAVNRATKDLVGSYSIGAISSDEPDRLIAARYSSPLVIGIGEGENFIASDIPAVLEHTKNYYILEDHELAEITKNDIKIYNQDLEPVEREITHVTWDAKDAQKDGYPFFMLKEINEQPRALQDAIRGRIKENGDIKLDDVVITKEDLDKIDHIQIVACGTAYNAGLIGKKYIEKYARIPIEIETASEYRYKNPIVTENTLLIVLSQSGETADTLAAIDIAKKNGARVLAITNVIGSSIARQSNDVIYTNAGPEIAVASTKAYVTQVACMMLVALHLGRLKGLVSDEKLKKLTTELKQASDHIQKALDDSEELEEYVTANKDHEDLYLIGRGHDYNTAIEGSLKIKEISYVHSESFSAGELKHGPIALIEDGTIVLAVATQEDVLEKVMSNIEEVRTRGGKVFLVTQEKFKDRIADLDKMDKVFFLPDMDDDIAPLASVVYLQLFAYFLAVANGRNVDQPRNLAKAVTVE